MKNLIFGIVMLLCTHTIYADPTSCESELSDLKLDGKSFFDKFNATHELAHEDLTGIDVICAALLGAIGAFTTESYGEGYDSYTLECNVTTFANAFYPLRDQALDLIVDLREKTYILLETARHFSRRHNFSSVSGANDDSCETALNNIKSDLAAFFPALSDAGVQALSDLQALYEVCFTLPAMLTDFTNDNALTTTCETNPTDVDQSDVLDAIKTFFVSFQDVHNAAHDKLVDIDAICLNLTATLAVIIPLFD